jgi:hypothetical protein
MATSTTTPAVPQAASSVLASVTRGKKEKPHYVIIYGVDGVGKSTFGAAAPKSVFLGCESGTDHMDVARFPQPANLGEFYNQLKALAEEKHDFESIVIDSVDWLEPLVWQQVCKEGNCKSIEDYGGGFGKGYVRAVEIWRGLMGMISKLAELHNVILIGHSEIKAFTDPEQPAAYDRYQLKLNPKAAAVIREAVDCVLFANFETTVVKEKGDRKGRGVGDGARQMYTERRPAFDAKNRFNLPFELPLSFEEYDKAMKAFYQGDKK